MLPEQWEHFSTSLTNSFSSAIGVLANQISGSKHSFISFTLVVKFQLLLLEKFVNKNPCSAALLT